MDKANSSSESAESKTNSPVRGILRRSSNRGDNDNKRGKPEVELIGDNNMTARPIDGNGVKKKSEKTKKRKVVTKKVKLQVPVDKGDETDAEMFDCEYCLSGEHESVIECER